WGPWAGAGLLTDPVAERLSRRGVTPMPPESAGTALDHALADGETCLTVVDIDWERFVPPFVAARPTRLFDDLATVARTEPGGDRNGVRERLAGLPAPARSRVLLDLVRGHAAAVLGHADGERLEPSRAFRDLGFDSVTAVDLRNRLAAAIGLALPPA